MWTLCGMDWVLGSSGFWIKQRWLKTLHHQSQTIKGQTRFKSLPHYFPEPCSLGRGLFPCKIIFFSIHTIYFSAPTLHILYFVVFANSNVSGRLDEKLFVKTSKGSVYFQTSQFSILLFICYIYLTEISILIQIYLTSQGKSILILLHYIFGLRFVRLCKTILNVSFCDHQHFLGPGDCHWQQHLVLAPNLIQWPMRGQYYLPRPIRGQFSSFSRASLT